MSRFNVTLGDGDGGGGRVQLVILIGLLTLCAELWSDNRGCVAPIAPITVEQCEIEICKGKSIRRYDNWSCECEHGQQ